MQHLTECKKGRGPTSLWKGDFHEEDSIACRKGITCVALLAMGGFAAGAPAGGLQVILSTSN